MFHFSGWYEIDAIPLLLTFLAQATFDNGIDVDRCLPCQRCLAPTEARLYNKSAAAFHPFQRFQQLRLDPFTVWSSGAPSVVRDLAKYSAQHRIYAITSWSANTGREDIPSDQVRDTAQRLIQPTTLYTLTR
jgi:hypothetical protein